MLREMRKVFKTISILDNRQIIFDSINNYIKNIDEPSDRSTSVSSTDKELQECIKKRIPLDTGC